MEQPAEAPLTAAAWDYLAAHRIGHLATVDADGHPSVVPICYAVDRRAIYSALDEKPKRVAPQDLRRVRNLRAHPVVALVVDDYAEDWTRLAYLLVHGHADLLLPDAPDHAAAVALLRAKYDQYQTMAIEAQPVIRVLPTRSTFWTASPEPPDGATVG
ncbi:MAG TPA: TIGR03668 family PPOX class F420-dependent oxidoreductase [Chloroflexota bacterium]|nr:TIGR03668 family PPOX class F420-dependent oxidoreductase [Chloroflexota bacterium]